MPQATKELRDKWDEISAWEQLKNKTNMNGFVIRFYSGYDPTEDDMSAVDYLFQEWDYGYEPVANEVL